MTPIPKSSLLILLPIIMVLFLAGRASASPEERDPVSRKGAGVENFAAESPLAWLILAEIKIGAEEYRLELDGEVLQTVRHNTFGLKYPLVPGRDHAVRLFRVPDGLEVRSAVLRPAPGQTIVMDYQALGSVRLNPLQNPLPGMDYRFYLNGQAVREQETLTNVWAGLSNTLTVLDRDSNEVYRETFYLQDREFRELTPRLKRVTGFFFRIFKTDDTYAGLGLDWNFHPQFWAGAGIGLANAINPLDGQNRAMLLPSVHAGYFLFGNSGDPVRCGAGLVAQAFLLVPDGTLPDGSPLTQSRYAGFGLFVRMESLVFYLEPSVLTDMASARFRIEFGIKI